MLTDLLHEHIVVTLKCQLDVVLHFELPDAVICFQSLASACLSALLQRFRVLKFGEYCFQVQVIT